MVEHTLVRAKEIFILRMFNVMGVRVILKSVYSVILEIMTVTIQKMLESAVKVCVSYIYVILDFIANCIKCYKELRFTTTM